jgi:hypothetical protein
MEMNPNAYEHRGTTIKNALRPMGQTVSSAHSPVRSNFYEDDDELDREEFASPSHMASAYKIT